MRIVGVDRGRFTSAIVGFFFGPIGLGIFFRSWRDFFYLTIIYLAVVFFLAGYDAAGAVFVASIICAIWGAVRAE